MLTKHFLKPYKDFPLYTYENFLIPIEEEFDHTHKYSLRTYAVLEKTLDKMNRGYNWHIKPYGFIGKLSNKFNKVLSECIGEKVDQPLVHVYVSNKYQYFDLWHTHTHTTASLTAVYYFCIDENTSSIEFEKDGNIIEHFPKQNELLLFPHNLNHRPTKKGLSEDYRITFAFDRIFTPQDRLKDIW